MKKQVSVLLGVCANTEYLFCDETFDGLDPVMRQTVKSLFASELLNRKFTPVIASHSLREIEDICDHIGLLHRGGILFAKDIDEMKLGIHKIQCVIPDAQLEEELLSELTVLQQDKRGSLLTVIARGSYDEVLQKIQEKQPLFSEILPLTLEEIFISETEVAGYDIKNLVF
jgi:ABC-2 type transport system ATP-binding protein